MDSKEARSAVVQGILERHHAPRAAAHYTKRLNLQRDELLAMISSIPKLSPLATAQFLVELDGQILSTNERLRHFLAHEQIQLKHVRYLCKWVRKWRRSKKRAVGCALSSYGLMLLVLYYLQRMGLLPVLDCSAYVVENRSTLECLTEHDIDERLDAIDKNFVSVNEHPKHVHDWRVLRRGFFRFFTCEFDYDQTVVSLRTTDVVSKASKDDISTRGDSEPVHSTGNHNSAREAREAERRVKLQHFLVLRAFNLRRPKETLHEQFQFLKKQVESSDSRKNVYILELDELCAYLSIPPYRRLVLIQVFGLAPHQTQLGFDDFVRFLQSAAVQAARKERQQDEGGLPIPPPRSARRFQLSKAVVPFDPLRMHQAVAHAPPAPGLWKKREITIQERITEYTKIDEKGQPQRLVEKERHQTEVMHMESLDGEFAHREITQFEQTEHLNDEMVHLDHGREEFLHLKSRHDEISRFESSVPSGGSGSGGGGRPEECEQQPPSPTIKRDPSAGCSGFDNIANEDDEEAASHAEAADQNQQVTEEEVAQQT
ncbi:hypothetical protein BBJ29_001872 [Phytophthora kernoviae]|uniref:PAP-associated domain-containing protein n=1 Tax=Phytophthora kernoviae TaxID=325452 RepID=A0A3F2RRH4_9STRA|nr:hypothetical protein BBJ29_001872 [Phytophthora kernoviae]RLN61961.1 hypothetical protein BBP00_00005062 [Phytophthora kernoviae]